MTLSLAGTRRDTGVSIAQVNLKLIWDVVSKIKVGEHGRAYVVDSDGRLIAHPDISLVLRNTDMSRLAQVKGARRVLRLRPSRKRTISAGHKVLTAYAPVDPLGWFVFVETPIEEAYAPLYRSILRTGYVLLGALVLAFIAGMFLACEAQFADIFIVEDDVLRLVAGFGEIGRPVDEPFPLDRSTIAGRTVVDMQPVHVVDVEDAGNEFALGRAYGQKFGHRTILGVPLIREGRALGAITIRRTEVRPFEQKHIALLSTFADQAAMAVELSCSRPAAAHA